MMPRRRNKVRGAPKRIEGKPGFELVEESLFLLRRTPVSTLAVYYLGATPFIIGVITFWAAMIQSAYAEQNLPLAALGLALLFVWMKVWQARFCRHLLAQLQGNALPAWRPGDFGRSLSLQAFIHATGFIALPFAMLLTIPFGWVYAAYQNVTVLDDGEYHTAAALVRSAVSQAKLWPKQNHLVIWLLSPFLLLVTAGVFLGLLPIVNALSPLLMSTVAYLLAFALAITILPLSPFGVVVALNIGTGILFGTAMLDTLFGVETAFSISSGAAFNSTFIAMVCGLAYLCMDPALKAAYVLRCFYGASLKTGEDLRVELRRYAKDMPEPAPSRNGYRALLAALLAGMALFFTLSGGGRIEAAPEWRVTPAQIDQALADELGEWQYTWRMPRAPRNTEEGFIRAFLRGMEETAFGYIRAAGRWISRVIRDWFKPDLGGLDAAFRALSAIAPFLRWLLISLSVLLLAALAAVLWRLWQRRQPRETALLAAAGPITPDIADEQTSAADLPEEGWMTLARELAAKGEYRLAIRALFLATLARLAAAGYVQIMRYKSNGEYLRELRRRAHECPALPPLFTESTNIYEAVWYGGHDPAERASSQRIWENFQRMPRIDAASPKRAPSHE